MDCLLQVLRLLVGIGFKPTAAVGAIVAGLRPAKQRAGSLVMDRALYKEIAGVVFAGGTAKFAFTLADLAAIIQAAQP